MSDALNTAEPEDDGASDPLLEQAEEGIILESGGNDPAAPSCCSMKALWDEIK